MTGTKSYLLVVAAFVSIALSNCAHSATATHRARMYFNVGSVDFDLYGNESPLHVANFLDYVDDRAYDRTWIHRSRAGANYFLQGGEYYLPQIGDEEPDMRFIVPGDPVPNEYDLSNGLTNSPGTLAAARMTDPDSATNGWFINTTDNSGSFHFYTVFGEATRGFNIVQAISSLPTGHSYWTSEGYSTAPIFNNFVVYQLQVVERSLLDGDFDLSGYVGASDLAEWGQDFGRLRIGGPDLNGDREIDSNDLINWEAGFGEFDGETTFADFEDGDADRNGVVDGFDFLYLQRSFGLTTDVSTDGNGDYRVDGFDFLEWQRNFGSGMPPVAAIVAPEPTTLFLANLAALFALLRRRSRSL